MVQWEAQKVVVSTKELQEKITTLETTHADTLMTLKVQLHCNTLQRIATHCNTLQHTATHTLMTLKVHVIT